MDVTNHDSWIALDSKLRYVWNVTKNHRSKLFGTTTDDSVADKTRSMCNGKYAWKNTIVIHFLENSKIWIGANIVGIMDRCTIDWMFFAPLVFP